MTGQWEELSLTAVPEAIDAIVEVFRSHGIAGIAIEPPIIPGPDDGAALGDGPCVLKAYLPLEADVESRVEQLERALWHLRAFDLAPMSELSRRTVAEADWANAWKDHFHPVRIGRRMIVKPSWREIEDGADDVVLELDPGMAFGTGLHPTTRMVLEALEEVVRPGDTVFDVGTGSGILSIAAAKLGAARVLAVDVDAVAVRVAGENVGLNGMEKIVTVSTGSADASVDQFDLVLANIIATVIAENAPVLALRVAPAGVLIASGIISERQQLVEDALAAAGMSVTARRQSGDWLCLICQHHASGVAEPR